MDKRQQAYQAGQDAHQDGASPLANPHTPAPPGDILLARLWRHGWHAAKRKGKTE